MIDIRKSPDAFSAVSAQRGTGGRGSQTTAAVRSAGFSASVARSLGLRFFDRAEALSLNSGAAKFDSDTEEESLRLEAQRLMPSTETMQRLVRKSPPLSEWEE